MVVAYGPGGRHRSHRRYQPGVPDTDHLGSNSIGMAMRLGAAIVYAAYVLLFVGRLARGVEPMELAAYVIAGKALSIGMGGVATGSLSIPSTTAAWTAVVVNSVMLSVGMWPTALGLRDPPRIPDPENDGSQPRHRRRRQRSSRIGVLPR